EQAPVDATGKGPAMDRLTAIVQAEGDGTHGDLDRPRLVLSRLHGRRRPVRTDLDMLNPFNQALPLIGREGEMEALKRWLEGPRSLAARCLIGRAGSGKTRLGLELCTMADGLGWRAGFVQSSELA